MTDEHRRRCCKELLLLLANIVIIHCFGQRWRLEWLRGEKKEEEGRRGGEGPKEWIKLPPSLPPSPLVKSKSSRHLGRRRGRPTLPTPLGLQSHENIPRGDPGSGEPTLNERISTRLASPRGLRMGRNRGFELFYSPASSSSLLLPSPKRTIHLSHHSHVRGATFAFGADRVHARFVPSGAPRQATQGCGARRGRRRAAAAGDHRYGFSFFLARCCRAFD